MKTVMKKMFSLLLVAVLLVGAMPFQAFADETVPVYINGEQVGTIAPGSYTLDAFTQFCTEGTEPDYLNLCHDPATHAAFGEYPGSVSAGQCIHLHVKNKAVEKCETCGQVKHNGLCEGQCASCKELNGHTAECPNNPANATYSLTMELKIGETSNEIQGTSSKSFKNGTSIDLKAVAEELFPSFTYMWTSLGKNVTTMTITKDETIQVRMAQAVVTSTCPTCHETYTGTTHTCPTCTEVSGCVRPKNHSGDHQCECGLYPQKGSAHNSNCPFDEDVITTPSGSYTVHVWGNLITGETKTERIWLGNIENVSGNALVRDVIGANKEYLKDQIAWKAPDFKWSENYYAENSSGKLIEIGSNTTVEAEDDIIINLYAEQKLVVVRVHTDKSYHVDMTVQVNGFKVKDVVTYDDVLKAVKKHYNVSSMKIYTYTEWEKVINGKDANKTTNFVVKGGSNDNVYEVYLTGSVKSSSSSSSATADSSNPKTGDMIFAPVAVMGLSVSALAVLFFLNKKRAY